VCCAREEAAQGVLADIAERVAVPPTESAMFAERGDVKPQRQYRVESLGLAIRQGICLGHCSTIVQGRRR
jgi:hypothetical protein